MIHVFTCMSFIFVCICFLCICVVFTTVVSEQHIKMGNVNSCYIKTFHIVNIIYILFKGISHCHNTDKEATVQDQINMYVVHWSMKQSVILWKEHRESKGFSSWKNQR